MTITIKNQSNVTKQLQYYRSKRFLTLNPCDTVMISNVTRSELKYYRSISGLFVTVQGHPTTTINAAITIAKAKVEPIVEEVKKEVPDPVVEETAEEAVEDTTEEEIIEETPVEEVKTLDLSKYTDEELKTILKNMGISTRYKLREKLENQIAENLPEGKTIEDYI